MANSTATYDLLKIMTRGSSQATNSNSAKVMPVSYLEQLPENFDRGRLSAMLAGSGDCIAFTSPSTVKNLAKLFDTHDLGKTLPGVVIACIGPITAAAAVEYGLRVDIEPAQQTVKHLVESIAAYYADLHR